jgi:putative SOS response-associated peptidase YedK
LTTAANQKMSWLHNSKKRQPVIIPREFEKDFLNPNLSDHDVLALCKSMPDDFLSYYSITKDISGNKLSSEQKNTPEIEKPVQYLPEELDEIVESKTPRSNKIKGDQGQGSLF